MIIETRQAEKEPSSMSGTIKREIQTLATTGFGNDRTSTADTDSDEYLKESEAELEAELGQRDRSRKGRGHCDNRGQSSHNNRKHPYLKSGV